MTNPESRRFPIARALLRFAGKARRNWLERHQDPRNFAIHMLGIPLAVAGLLLLFFVPWYWGVGGLVLGYFLQWVGHRWEGNDVGEWAAIKRLAGLPTVAISPRFARPHAVEPEQSTKPA
ncbi:MAG: Mpo1-like protein [Gemmataceae bacterium]